MFISQGDYIWIEPISGREFDVAIGARVISAEGRRIQVKDDDNKVMESYTKKNVARLSREEFRDSYLIRNRKKLAQE